MEEIEVRAGSRNENCRILIKRGLLNSVGRLTASFGFSKFIVVSNPVVMGYHGETLIESLKRAGIEPVVIIIPDGEAYKTLDTFTSILDKMLKARCDRKSVMLAFGGGVTGDLAGFAASAYMRGISLIQIPTTLLAQVDSSIGGKVGVDFAKGKNIVGAFYNPLMVITDPELLKTLPAEEMSNGLAEVIKSGIIGKPEILKMLEGSPDEIPPDVLEILIRLSASLKAEIVNGDFTEKGLRMKLNLGHTLGHGLESAGDFRGPAHGQAVAMGMLAAAEIAEMLGILEEKGLRKRLEKLYLKFWLPVCWSGLDPERVLSAVSLDKKNQGEKIRFVLPVRTGQVEVIEGVELSTIKAAAEKLLFLKEEEE